MSLNLLFKIGNFFAVTPPSIHIQPSTKKEKIKAFCFIFFYTVSVSISFFFRVRYYSKYIHLNVVIKTIVDCSLYFLNILTVIIAVAQRNDWLTLIQSLGNEKSSKNWPFIMLNVLFWIVMINMSYIFTKLKSWEFYKKYAIEYLQLYVQFLISVLICTILKKFQQRYKSVNRVLLYQISQIKKHKKSNLVILKSLKHDLVNLKDGIDSFNTIFGWPILLILIFVTLQDLAYLNSFFKLKNRLVIVSNFLMMSMITVSNSFFDFFFKNNKKSLKLQFQFGCVIQFLSKAIKLFLHLIV